MAFADEHMYDCRELLGNGWGQVHRYLDQMTAMYPPSKWGEYHRTFFHNTYGLTIIEHKWGTEGKGAALIHLHRDYMEQSIIHKELTTIIGLALLRMPWWDNIEYGDSQWYNLKGD